MSEDEMNKMIEAYGFTSRAAEDVMRICREVERDTRHEFFRFIQIANNAASTKTLTAKELDNLVWCADQSKRESMRTTK